MWNKVNDTFFHQKLAKVQEDKTDYTLRKLLSLIACLFDPLGIIAPLLITLKIILQHTWKERLAWDDLLSDEKTKINKNLDTAISKCARNINATMFCFSERAVSDKPVTLLL